MSPTAAAEATSTRESLVNRSDEQSSDMENDEVLGKTATRKRSYESDDKEDPATQAASENLKHTTISDKEPLDSIDVSATMTEAGPPVPNNKDERQTTPEPLELSDAQDAEMKERISSPKKKRGREQDDEVRDLEAAGSVEHVGASPDGSSVNGGRTTRSAPEKKRHRDASVDTVVVTESGPDAKEAPACEPTETAKTSISDLETLQKSPKSSPKPVFGSSLNEKPHTSSSAFTSSGFGSLAASSTSGFAALAASKPSVFGAGANPQVSGFGSLAAAKPLSSDTLPLKSGFGISASDSSGNTMGSGFANTGKSGFGGLGGGFSGGFGGFSGASRPKLFSFAASGAPDIIGAEKPAKAFGAPESDEDEDDDDNESGGGAASDEDENISVDDKKKQKVSRVPINDGEEEEATLLQFRAKLYTLVSKEKGWKERGVGTLKLNVAKSFVDFDENGTPLLGSFDPSTRDDNDEDGGGPTPTAARLIMRQENTHRVILNTVILKALKFEEKASSSAIQILFTAFEETKPVNMLLKMSEANARIFTAEIASIQKEL